MSGVALRVGAVAGLTVLLAAAASPALAYPSGVNPSYTTTGGGLVATNGTSTNLCGTKLYPGKSVTFAVSTGGGTFSNKASTVAPDGTACADVLPPPQSINNVYTITANGETATTGTFKRFNVP